MVESMDIKEPTSIAEQPPAVLAEFLSKLQAKTFSKLTAVELEDIRIPGTPQIPVLGALQLSAYRERHRRYDFMDGAPRPRPLGRLHS